MAIDGIKGLVITFVYGTLPFTIMSVFVGSVIISILVGSGPDTASIFGSTMTLVGPLVLLVLGLLAAYIVPAALTNYTEADRPGSTFDVGALRPVLTSDRYVIAWFTVFVVLFAVSVILDLPNAIPLLGRLFSFAFGSFVGFYAVVAAYYIAGQTWGKLRGVEMMGEGRISGEQPAAWERISTSFRLF